MANAAVVYSGRSQRGNRMQFPSKKTCLRILQIKSFELLDGNVPIFSNGIEKKGFPLWLRQLYAPRAAPSPPRDVSAVCSVGVPRVGHAHASSGMRRGVGARRPHPRVNRAMRRRCYKYSYLHYITPPRFGT